MSDRLDCLVVDYLSVRWPMFGMNRVSRCQADAKSDSKEWSASVGRIAGRSKRLNSTAPTADSLDEVVERWAEYGETKSAASARAGGLGEPHANAACKYKA